MSIKAVIATDRREAAYKAGKKEAHVDLASKDPEFIDARTALKTEKADLKYKRAELKAQKGKKNKNPRIREIDHKLDKIHGKSRALKREKYLLTGAKIYSDLVFPALLKHGDKSGAELFQDISEEAKNRFPYFTTVHEELLKQGAELWDTKREELYGELERVFGASPDKNDINFYQDLINNSSNFKKLFLEEMSFASLVTHEHPPIDKNYDLDKVKIDISNYFPVVLIKFNDNVFWTKHNKATIAGVSYAAKYGSELDSNNPLWNNKLATSFIVTRPNYIRNYGIDQEQSVIAHELEHKIFTNFFTPVLGKFQNQYIEDNGEENINNLGFLAPKEYYFSDPNEYLNEFSHAKTELIAYLEHPPGDNFWNRSFFDIIECITNQDAYHIDFKAHQKLIQRIKFLNEIDVDHQELANIIRSSDSYESIEERFIQNYSLEKMSRFSEESKIKALKFLLKSKDFQVLGFGSRKFLFDSLTKTSKQKLLASLKNQDDYKKFLDISIHHSLWKLDPRSKLEIYEKADFLNWFEENPNFNPEINQLIKKDTQKFQIRKEFLQKLEEIRKTSDISMNKINKNFPFRNFNRIDDLDKYQDQAEKMLEEAKQLAVPRGE
ncbi:MAG: hypothetical protein HRT47_02840 [Candidatus Caenarcaniphilales bacterium]|nr:hypothetical protein [Candidatus Caenarcaniphilales bacterium]